MKKIRYMVFYICVVLALFFFGLMAQLTFPYYTFRLDIGFLLTKQNVIHRSLWRWAFYIHITCSSWLLLLGISQFSNTLKKRYPQVHIWVGKVYVALICFLAAPSGFILALYANGGLWAQLSFSLLSLCWFGYTYKGYIAIRHGHINRHVSFMYKSYILTLSAIILRLLVMILPHFFILPAQQMYTLVSWLSWIPSLLITELYFWHKSKSINNP